MGSGEPVFSETRQPIGHPILRGTLIGLAGGHATLSWMTATLSAATVTEAPALGILTVAVAPLFTLRRLRRMDIPSRLRVME